MTLKEKLSMFFEHLLEQVEEIDNKEIKEYALRGLEQQVVNQMHIIHKMLDNQEQTKGDNNG